MILILIYQTYYLSIHFFFLLTTYLNTYGESMYEIEIQELSKLNKDKNKSLRFHKKKMYNNIYIY